MRRFLACGILIMVVGATLTGCSNRPTSGGAMDSNREVMLSAPAASAPMLAKAPAPPGEYSNGATPEEKPVTMPRKIIYTADTEVRARDFGKAREGLLGTIQKYGGYVSESNVSGTSGQNRTGTWKVRVPVANFDAFLHDLGGLGDVENTRINSEDVSEEFYDLEARLKNKRVEEERLIQHLKVSTGKLTDILAVEKEISRVREEIERMEGRRRFLMNQTDLTTVTVTVREMSQLVPTTEPGLPAQMQRVFLESLAGIAHFGRAILLLIVGMTPVAALISVMAVPIWYTVKRRRRARAAAQASISPSDSVR